MLLDTTPAAVLGCFPPAPARTAISSSTVAVYESESERNPRNPKLWLLYLRAEADAHPLCRFEIFERAVRANPRSYKLWKMYLEERTAFVLTGGGETPAAGGEGGTHRKPYRPGHAAWRLTNLCFERALAFLSTLPKLWEMYLEFLLKQKWEITSTRRAFDKALQSVAITQHERIWKLFAQLAEENKELPLTAIPILERRFMIEPSQLWALCDLLEMHGRFDAAAVRLAAALSSDSPPVGRSRHTIWRRLCGIVAAHPVRSLDTSAVLQAALARVSADGGSLWAALAVHRLRVHRQAARDVFEAALRTVATTADFAVVFDAYVGFYQSLLKEEAAAAAGDGSTSKTTTSLELEVARLRELLSRRQELRSDAALRQNPHNVAEWLARAQLFSEDPAAAAAVLSQGVVTVDPFRAVGKPMALWLRLAALYAAHGDAENANAVFEKAVRARFRSSDDLVSVWCRWIEGELQAERWQKALELARRAVHRPGLAAMQRRAQEAAATAATTAADSGATQAFKSHTGETGGEGLWQRSMCKSVRLWSLLLDLERSLGSDATLAAAFERVCDSKAVTPRLLLSHANELEQRKRWGESFRCYERGVALFRFPHAYRLWVTYLSKFMARFQGRQLERARELFEQALAECPPHLARRIILMFAMAEETYGVPRRALAVLAEGTKKVEEVKDKFDIYRLLAAKTAEFLGVTKARAVWAEAISTLSSDAALCVAASMQLLRIEKGLGEVARARGVLKHASQFAGNDEEFWKTWRAFEVQHGNEETFRDWLLAKRALTSQKKTEPVVGLESSIVKNLNFE